MKISSNSFYPVTPRPSDSPAGSPGHQGVTGSRSKAAQVELSAAARKLAALENDQHDIDIVKVQALREALANGTLKIDPERIADGLINSARELVK